jgi:ribokinase
MSHVLVIGSANMDVIAPLQRMPSPGETILIEDVRLVPGGKGANAAVSAARLGADVRFIGCVGDDAFGRTLRNGLIDEGIDCEHLGISTRGSGTAVILLNRADAQNAIMVGPGANHELTLPGDDALFRWADILMLQLETPIGVNIEAVRRARACGLKVILDHAPATSDLPNELLYGVDILSPNENELATLAGRPVSGIEDAIAAADVLYERGVNELVVKLGDKGALRYTGTGHEHFQSTPVKPVDTTAAGDAFTGALAVSIADGDSMPDAIRLACLAGALACTKLGAQPSLPTRAQVQAYAAELSR